MPTPNDHPLSAPSDTDTRTSFATCPPEEEREQLRAQERRNDLHSYSALEVDEEEHTSEQEGEASGILHDNGMKTEHVEDISVLTDVSSASSPESSQENEACSFDTPDVEYLDMMSGRERIRPSITCPFLQPGSRFHGKQQSDRQTYDVQVEIKDVNMAESFLCGYLRIQGLTDDHPTLTTFFEGEIIGPKHRFKTTNPSWGSNEKVDLQHWERFPAWRPLAKSAKSPNFTLKNFLQREHLFMRWKEYFLVPDHRVKTITGASFEGFYYICFNQCDGSVSGIYFHAKSEKYQRLELKHVEDHGCLAAMEFR